MAGEAIAWWRRPDSERILESNERRHFVANTVVVEREKDVHIQEHAADHVDFGSKRPAEDVERLGRERHGGENGRPIERMEILETQTLRIEQVTTKDVERDRQASRIQVSSRRVVELV